MSLTVLSAIASNASAAAVGVEVSVVVEVEVVVEVVSVGQSPDPQEFTAGRLHTNLLSRLQFWSY